ncbi:hypothetical protein F5148DRAFT_716434 [Russula earlei]|uniref:Uncharacterized protein n=1 Tax=Russula earlei TaxID=71964 RepID=A0ACC0UD74_9AGAM|nr:hypothetical protein F5148DRAFT_716434 [Russula earlei]
MSPSLDAQQIVASLTGITPFLWPFILLSLGVALTPISPLLWNYSTWLLFIIPLVITVFAPIRTFSGPIRYAYLEYASKVTALLVSFLGVLAVTFKSLPTLALPAFFILPVLPILFFVLFPALPVIWHYISYHYRRRLKAVTTSVSRTTAGLNLFIARAQQAVALAHTHEKQALYTFSASRSAASLTFPRLSTDFIDSSVSAGQGQQSGRRKAELVRTLGAGLADKVIASETKMTNLEDQAAKLRILLEQAVAVAVEGDMGAGEALAADAATSLEGIVKQVEELCSAAEETRRIWVEYRRRLNALTTSVSGTTAGLDRSITRAQQAVALAHTHEKQALYTVSATRNAASLTFPRLSTDFIDSSVSAGQGQQSGRRKAELVRTLGAGLAEKVVASETKMTSLEDQAAKLRTLVERAVEVAVEGNMDEGEALAANAATSLEGIIKQVEELCSAAEETRRTWVEYRRRLHAVTTSTSKTAASLDFIVARARRVTALAHTYEKEVLVTISTTRRTASFTLALHSVDFFDTSTSAWAALGHTTARTEDLVKAARDVIPVANQLRQSYPNDNRPLVLAEILFDRASDVVTASSEVERLARMAQDSVGRSKNAQSQAEQARRWVQTEAERVRTLGVRLVDIMVSVETQISGVERDAEEVRAVLEQAVAVAAEGDMDRAEGLAANTAESLKRVVKQVEGLSSAADAARQTWVELSVK